MLFKRVFPQNLVNPVFPSFKYSFQFCCFACRNGDIIDTEKMELFWLNNKGQVSANVCVSWAGGCQSLSLSFLFFFLRDLMKIEIIQQIH